MPRQPRCEAHRLAVRRHRQVELKDILQADAQIVIGFGEVGPDANGLAIGLGRCLRMPGSIERHSQIEAALCVEGIDRPALQTGGQQQGVGRLGNAAEALQHLAQQEMGLGRVRLEPYRLGQPVQGFRQRSPLAQQPAQTARGFGVVGAIGQQLAVDHLGDRQIAFLLDL